ncbi:MAG: RNA polymerase sigma factor [Actinomycetota bacterium]
MLDDEGRRRLESAYREFGSELWRAIHAFAGGRQDVADEAVAEAFAQAGRRVEAIRSLRPWIFRAAFRIASAELGRVRRASSLSEVGDAPAAEEGSGAILERLAGLSPRQRRVFLLRDVLGYSTRESAELLSVSDVSVRVHLHAARRRLRELLSTEREA